MFTGTNRVVALAFIATALIVLAAGCSTDKPVAPTASDTGAEVRLAAGTIPQEAGPPSEGAVVEGVSVPGIDLGFTRAQVEQAYGEETVWCQSSGEPGNRAFCAWAVNGGGQVSVYFRGPDGGDATNSPEDVVSRISWSESVSGWTTTAGVNTTLAREDRQAVVAAYPNARVTYQLGAVYSVTDYPQGIEIVWVPNFYTGTVSIRMSIFPPRDPPPLPEQITYVHKIDVQASKVKGKRQIRAWVGVRDQTHLAAEGATVLVTWALPDGSTQAAESVTSASGNAYFDINSRSRGTYTLTVEDVALEDHRFDSENSVLSASVTTR